MEAPMDMLYECVRIDLGTMDAVRSKGGLSKEEATRRANRMNALYKRNNFDTVMVIRLANAPKIVV